MSGWLIAVLLVFCVALELGFLDPVLRPVGRVAGRMTNRWTVGLLWIAAVGMGMAFGAAIEVSPAAGTLELSAALVLGMLAVLGTITLWGRRRAARRELARVAAAQPRPQPLWHPAARVYGRSM